jgi:hypothetical protein
MGWIFNATPRLHYPHERDLATTVKEGDRMGPNATLDGCGKSHPTRIRSPNRLVQAVVTPLSRPAYEHTRESNENFKSVIKFRNQAPLSCNLTTVLLIG